MVGKDMVVDNNYILNLQGNSFHEQKNKEIVIVKINFQQLWSGVLFYEM